MAKGGSFEREICKLLSSWWTNGERDDVFWRSASSGGRATVRHAKGKSTYGQYGDIQAVDPIGNALTKHITIECKRGYTKATFADAVDRPDHLSAGVWETFVEQAETSAVAAGSKGWLLIQRRNKRQSLVFFPVKLYNCLRDEGGCFTMHKPSPFVRMIISIKTTTKTWRTHQVVCMQLSSFLEEVTRDNIEKLT